ncbi:MAG: acyltransferase [Planctomycetes bacterium]|nr:acyltransferase [Planctomycetota bacterium]
MKKLLKKTALTLRNVIIMFEFVLAILLVIPCVLLGWFGIFCHRYVEVSIVLSKVPFALGEYLRFFYYKCTLKKVGRRVKFKYGSFCHYRDTIIGNNVVIGYYSTMGKVTIGDDVVIGGYVLILSGTQQHYFDDPNKKIIEHSGKKVMVSIGNDVWIGSKAVVMNDVGHRCIIGAGSVVVDKVEDHSIAAGNPARLIKKLE